MPIHAAFEISILTESSAPNCPTDSLHASTSSPVRQRGNAVTMNPSPLLPDVATSRKNRINNELVVLFKRSCPLNSNPVAKGIGLYTHVDGQNKIPQFPHERYLKHDPTFLPIGGPRRVGRRAGLEAQVSNEIQGLWRELKDAVEEVGKDTGTAKFSAEELKERHGGLDVPEHVAAEVQMQHLRLNEQDSTMQLDGTGQESANTPVTPGLDGQSSWAAWLSCVSDLVVDSTTSGTEPTRRDSAAKPGNRYEIERDPRKKGR